MPSLQTPCLLDLFCGAGGAAMGYHRAGFGKIVGVDHVFQKRYPFTFVQADALEFLAEHGDEFDVIHASPPCQHYSFASFTRMHKSRHPDLIAPVRGLLTEMGLPYVIENVIPAPCLRGSIVLCGLMFGLRVFRHRVFESSMFLFEPSHPSHRGKVIGVDGMQCVVGHGGGVSARMRTTMKQRGNGNTGSKADWSRAMGIDWMTRDELSQAIPPAYTEYLGRQLIARM